MNVDVAPRLFGILGGLGMVTGIGALLFACAGRADLPMFWAYLGMWTALAFAAPLVMDPGLIRERMLPGPGARDSGRTFGFVVLASSQFVVAGLDVGRFHWTDGVPRALQVAGLVAASLALAVTLWASAVNPFFSSVIRIQTERGHRVITSGPYRLVRHPAYAAAPFLFVGSGLALGSWLAALIGVLLVVLLVWRAADEDRVLRAELDGYAAYAGRVRYRLFPGVW